MEESDHNLFQVSGTVLGHTLLTAPSCILHGIINLYRRTSAPQPIIPSLENKKVVVFIHGRGGHHTNFNTLISNLQSDKRFTDYYFVSVDLGWNIETSVDVDVDKLHQELDKFINCEISLIGMSKGGLVCSRYITLHNNLQIKRIITVSSPLRGTRVADLLPANSITNKELGYNSTFTDTIAQIIASKNIAIYHVVPQWDNLIVPTTSAKYDSTPDTNILYYQGYHSHVGILHDPEITNAITNWLLQ